eukprot:TRINITY_DN4585_c0_g1_i1.p1 TRINITY_DN4585_c0_g1~~TRINITY_DN4585_c0_g1_i1.p1  ORF type:complete len:233 (-),score=42.14 TRINITY_DN4585_c0_g1_i1:134-832(-)
MDKNQPYKSPRETLKKDDPLSSIHNQTTFISDSNSHESVQRFMNTFLNEKTERKKREEMLRMAHNEKSKSKILPFSLPNNTRVTVSEVNADSDISRGLFSKTILEFDGSEKLPSWVRDSVVEGIYESRVNRKIKFVLFSVSPTRMHKSFTSERLTPMKKVITWICENVSEISVHRWPVEPCVLIQIFCNNTLIPPAMDAGTVSHFFWKSNSKVMELEWRINSEYYPQKSHIW